MSEKENNIVCVLFHNLFDNTIAFTEKGGYEEIVSNMLPNEKLFEGSLEECDSKGKELLKTEKYQKINIFGNEEINMMLMFTKP